MRDCFAASTVPIAEYQLFMVVDVSSLPVLRLRMQVAHPRFNVTRYRVQLWRSSRQPDGNSWVVHSQILITPPNTSEDTVLVVSYNSEYKPGVYNFTALPIHPHCTEHNPCTLSRAPEVLIGMLKVDWFLFFKTKSTNAKIVVWPNLYGIYVDLACNVERNYNLWAFQNSIKQNVINT